MIQCRRPAYAKPELLATGPNQVWSWDITKLKGPEKWTYFYLYVILDIFSRYAVGWLVAATETAALAKRLIAETCDKQAIAPDQLTLHSDRGAPMTAKTTAQLLADPSSGAGAGLFHFHFKGSCRGGFIRLWANEFAPT